MFVLIDLIIEPTVLKDVLARLDSGKLLLLLWLWLWLWLLLLLLLLLLWLWLLCCCYVVVVFCFEKMRVQLLLLTLFPYFVQGREQGKDRSVPQTKKQTK